IVGVVRGVGGVVLLGAKGIVLLRGGLLGGSGGRRLFGNGGGLAGGKRKIGCGGVGIWGGVVSGGE
ncbi:hypothetical protein, partial [Staphylococcus saprophyticus]|uniref:hypothetical protein n=1 Tax=Staphylococcus saprophyticus TaxID=29385 RepID=UPI001CD9461B